MGDVIAILVVLACPLMMIFMMRGRHGADVHRADAHDSPPEATAEHGSVRLTKSDVDARIANERELARPHRPRGDPPGRRKPVSDDRHGRARPGC